MIRSFPIDDILNSPSKLAILRVLASRKGFKATGREIAKLSGYSVPASHETLKDLHARDVLLFEVIGKQHIYSLNEENRIVQKVIHPMFKVESGFKEEICDFLLNEITKAHIKAKILSLILYGSTQQGTAKHGSDVDIAVVIKKASELDKIQDIFISQIEPRFKEYFGVYMDPYVKSAIAFRQRLKKNQPPISSLMKSYSVLYGKEPLEV